ncbi:hypothetical protein K505DRAFT_368390 [Melanomma pulvis-pyrius CBS 109.77]|uniref:DUF7770 domain-containing protein n=1 Tax=Melanomma pulvis-pyrius CBS 109.77 TaxID=1314802 RepID=A0A6A6WQQ9_9PLEO|nr:hypothetical protein K505DRAFT_368390 [Melanomma pulvis-pyrius CBS 109.77]
MNDNYDTDYFKTVNLTRLVIAIYICGYRNDNNAGDEDGNLPTNHWAAFLQLTDSTSVSLDMAPGYGSDGQRGKIQVASKDYVHTQNAIKSVMFPTTGAYTVSDIINLITQNGREKYTFTEAWEGCRYWIYTFISDLEAAGIIPAGSGQTTWGVVSYYWRNPSGYELRTVAQGTFR